MQVASPSPLPRASAQSPSRSRSTLNSFGSTELDCSPATPSRRRLRRSLRLSGASLSSPQNALNKENIGSTPLGQPSTSAKTLDIGLSGTGTLSSPKLSSPLTSSSPVNSSPLRTRSPHKQNRSPLRRTLHSQGDGNVSSSDDSDDSTLVFFGKPSSAEKKKRVHYEQRVLEKRLKHKDSLDLARRRSISFNPDDTMLIDDPHANGWSWNKPTPTPSRLGKFVLSSAAQSPDISASPTRSLTTAHASSPEPLGLSLPAPGHVEEPAATISTPMATANASPSSEVATAVKESSSTQTDAAEGVQEVLAEGHAPVNEPAQSTVKDQQSGNPFVAAPSSSEKDLTAKRSPSKQQQESSQRIQSPVRSVETLIGAAMAQNKDLVSPSRSPRRSPRLSLRALQLSTSPTKTSSTGLFLGTSTPFRQLSAMQQSTPLPQSTPLQQPAVAQPVPPSTGLSRFACLQNLSPINGRVLATPGGRVLSMQMAHPSTLPSPFISGGLFESTFTVPPTAPLLASPSRTPSRTMRLASPGKAAALSPSHVRNVSEQVGDLQRRLASGASLVPGTPSVRFALPALLETPSKVDISVNEGLQETRSPSPSKVQAVAETAASPQRASPPRHAFTSPLRQQRDQATLSLATPPSKVAENKAETPGPAFRQTARRVPIQQHEAEFGVKLSPEKPSYSPRRAYANSSARTNEFGAKAERVPARRVVMQPTVAARQASGKMTQPQTAGAARVASVASKAARSVSTGTNRIGGHSSSLPATALSRFASATHAASSVASAPATAAVQSAARSVSSTQGSSVASKASRLQRPASVAFGAKPNSPSKQPRSMSGLPRPKPMQPAASSVPASGPGSRLPRPATVGLSAAAARPTSRPVPMAVARLAPSQQGVIRTPTASAAPKGQAIVTPASVSSAESSPASEASDATPEAALEVKQIAEESKERSAVVEDVETAATSLPAAVAPKQPMGTLINSGLRRQASASALRDTSREAEAQSQARTAAESSQSKAGKVVVATGDDATARSSSPVVPAPAAKSASPVRSAPAVVLDAEQRRLRCLAMQEKARNRTPKGSSSSSAAASSDMEELPSSEASAARGSPLSNAVESAPASAPTAVEALAAKHAEAVDAASSTSAPSNVSSAAAATAGAPAASAGRPLRSARNASRTLTPSATRVPPARGRALSLNDIIAARKIDVPLSLTDQLKLADTVNKKHNEKTLARYKVTKIKRPYERPPSPDRHDHEPEACTIIDMDDVSSHRQGKGDLSPYSTPPKSASSAAYSSANARKSVRWYRPLFVGQGAQYGTQACEVRPALKPISYELDKLGNKVATGSSPKLLKGHAIVIYRNYFKGEPEPADD